MNRRFPYALFLAAAAALLLLAPGVARADPGTSEAAPISYYLALGDSLAGGAQAIGGPPFALPPGGYNQGYANQLHRALLRDQPALQLVKLGCGGMSALTFLNGVRFCPYEHGTEMAEAVAFLQAHPGQVELITISLGGNDVSFPPSGGFCFDPATGILDAACVTATLPAIQERLATILAQVRQAAGPDVPIIGMNYYNPFLGFWLLGPVGQLLARIDNAAVETLNAGLEQAYAQAGVPVADVASAFDISNFTDTTELEGVGIVPINVANACNWTWFCTGPPLGPDVDSNTDGYGVIANAFLDALGSWRSSTEMEEGR
jgi:lysophospholipase L1-like esterase